MDVKGREGLLTPTRLLPAARNLLPLGEGFGHRNKIHLVLKELQQRALAWSQKCEIFPWARTHTLASHHRDGQAAPSPPLPPISRLTECTAVMKDCPPAAMFPSKAIFIGFSRSAAPASPCSRDIPPMGLVRIVACHLVLHCGDPTPSRVVKSMAIINM